MQSDTFDKNAKPLQLSNIMKFKAFLIAVLSCVILTAQAETFYPLLLFGGYDGRVEIYNTGGQDFSFSGSTLTTSFVNQRINASYQKTLSNGDKYYTAMMNVNGLQFQEDFIVNPEKNMVMEITYAMPGKISSIIYYTNSKAKQLEFYADNRHNQTKGIDFSKFDTPSSSSSSSSSSAKKSGTCSKCNGTGINPLDFDSDGMNSWIGYYHRGVDKCRYCNKYAAHIHHRCAYCNVPGVYHK